MQQFLFQGILWLKFLQDISALFCEILLVEILRCLVIWSIFKFLLFLLADSWPQVFDDNNARKDWMWQHEYDLPKMCYDMFRLLGPGYGKDFMWRKGALVVPKKTLSIFSFYRYLK